MNQKIPTIKDEDILRLVKREFPKNLVSKVISILDQYTSQSKGGKNRVLVSIIKLSDGNLIELIKNTERAKDDFRDIISNAEYPNFTENFTKINLSKKMEKRLIQEDWNQFKFWFDRR